MTSPTFWLLLASFILSLAQADKPYIFPYLDPLDEHDEWKPPHPGFTIESWVGSYYPQFCSDEAQKARHDEDDPRPFCAVDQIQVFNITYQDCDRPWVLCRCPDAETNIAKLAKGFGRLPPGLRVGVAHVMAVSGKRISGNIDAPVARNAGGRVWLKGLLFDFMLPHEAFHSTDDNFHNSTAFSDAYNQDTCVPSSYANVSPEENFAELGTWVHYDMNGWPIKNWLKKDISIYPASPMMSRISQGSKVKHQRSVSGRPLE